MSKGDFDYTESATEEGAPDFCSMGKHAWEIIVTDVVERHCNDCGITETVSEDECIDRDGEWHPEHEYHFGVCRRCEAEAKQEED